MAFELTEQHISGFYRDGYTVFRGIIPPALLADLRRETDKARQIARAGNPQAQRLQPVSAYDDLDQKVFADYAHLPPLVDALENLVGLGTRCGRAGLLGVLLEPRDRPWCTNWHRDFRDHMRKEVFEAEFRADWDKQVYDITCMNQINCALWEDNCTWFVPGSHFRQRNLASEEAHIGTLPDCNDQSLSDEKLELHCRAYASGMPDAVQLCLNAGDFALYRPSGWHMGNYLPYRRRATLHDAAMNDDVFAAWQARNKRWREVTSAKG